MISVVVADDHPFVLHGVANVLRSNSEITVVTACNDGSAAWSRRFCSRNARGCSNSGIAVNPAKVPKLTHIRLTVIGCSCKHSCGQLDQATSIGGGDAND